MWISVQEKSPQKPGNRDIRGHSRISARTVYHHMVLSRQHQADIQWSTGFPYILIKLAKLETVQTYVNNSM